MSEKDIVVISGCNVGVLFEVGFEFIIYLVLVKKLVEKLVKIS